MKQTLFSLLVLFLYGGQVFAQCPTAPLTLASQSEVDSFRLKYPGCTDFPTYLTIEGNNITNLDSLSGLKKVKSALAIKSCGNLENLLGLSKIELVEGEFLIYANPKLVDLAGLSSLKKVKGNFNIQYNALLKNVDGLSKLTDLDGGLTVLANPVLTSLGGLGLVEYIGGNAEIFTNKQLKSLQGLNAVAFINGWLTIYGNDKLENCSGLDNLEYIGKNLSVYSNPVLVDFTGLEKLANIGVDFNVFSNPKLTDFTGLSELANVGGNMDVFINGLISINGLPKLNTLGGHLNILSNPNLTSITGMNAFTTMFNDLTISNNGKLAAIDAFKGLNYIGGSLKITGNAKLATINGFDSLTTINQSFNLTSNNLLAEISGFGKLQGVGKQLSVTSNPNLLTLGSLSALDQVQGKVDISFNTLLADCNAYFLCDKLAAQFDSVTIKSNAEGCNNKNELASVCTGIYPFARGRVFADFNCDSIENGDDFALANRILHHTNDFPFATTNHLGNYIKLVKPGIPYYFKMGTIAGYINEPATRYLKSQVFNDSFPHEDFRLCPDGEVTNLCVSVAPSNNPRPGFTTIYTITIANVGNTIAPGTFILDVSDPYIKGRIDTIFFSLQPDATTGPAHIWNIDSLWPFESLQMTVSIKWETTLPIGVFVTTQYNISPVGSADADNSNNIIALRQTSVGSLDPNDKTVNLPKLGLQVSQNFGSLDYIIRFQNTGNFPASFINVIDTVPELLDIKTIEMLGASHPYVLEFPADNVLQWRFDDINLPDSTSDEPGSHGYVLFRMKTAIVDYKLDSILNRCGIYFDYNAPVITNYAKTIVSKEIIAIGSLDEKMKLQAFPNPVSDVCWINFNLESTAECAFQLTDMNGKWVRAFPKRQLLAGANSVKVNLEGLPGGAYFLEVKNGAGIWSIKLIKQ